MPERILIIDDDENMRSSLQMELESEGYEVAIAENGFKAIELAQGESFDLILCDVRMPGIGGLETIAAIKEYLPVARNIVITAYASQDAPITALRMKVDDYLMKPFSSEELLHSVRSSVAHYKRSESESQGSIHFREGFLKLISGIFFESHIAHLAGHSERIARLSLRIGREYHLSPSRMHNLYLAALLHDIGYVELPPHLFEKEKLSGEEYELIKSHPSLGRDLLSPFRELKEVSIIVLHHHERWDGTGYPGLLKEAQIPLESRIIGTLEAYDSLINERPHRRKCTAGDALRKLGEDAGTFFDPDVLKKLAGVIANDDDEKQELPPITSEETEKRATFLINLAEVYRDLRSYEVASNAYDQADNLLTGRDSPELLMKILMGRISILSEQGNYREALDRAMEGLKISREKSLHFSSAGLELQIARLRMKLGETSGVAEGLEQARKVYSTWESSYHLCEVELILSALAIQEKNEQRFQESFGRFLALMQRGEFLDLFQKYRAQALPCLKSALGKGLFTDRLSWLFRESTGAPNDLLDEILKDESLRPVAQAVLGKLAISGKGKRGARAGEGHTMDTASRGTSESPPLPHIEIFLFGKLRILIDGVPLDDEVWITRKARSVFAYLASRRGEAQSEDKLMDLFWYQGGEKARHSLHNSISLIRKIFSPFLGEQAKKIVINKKDGYLLSAQNNCHIDLEEFDRRYQRGKALLQQNQWDDALLELQNAERLYVGDFLEDSYDEWSDSPRLRSRGRFVEIMDVLAKYFFNRHKYEVSTDYWKRIHLYDNCHEDAYLGLMMSAIALDNKNEAIRIYHKCVQVLKSEMNLAPPPKVMDTYLRLIEGKKVEMAI